MSESRSHWDDTSCHKILLADSCYGTMQQILCSSMLCNTDPFHALVLYFVCSETRSMQNCNFFIPGQNEENH